ncbi:hypothetical protein A1Q2_08357 [Trichosporon asahii var. asahii CBS 8904]|uniref:Exoribonuclease phosphorolytic domain-containing protein n=1 Tax=Trichosporon asahii var. asahii (strain CBS 8904) TaxID=1220162 RepID=K1V0H5_TRIAC|nr:hypothetical protein A1Q2_08357 [Trichosporon asahii var. asahii CBS 8904]
MRSDGRQDDSLRPLQVRLGELSRADGSGRFSFGPSAALASFTGPTEIRLREEQLSQATLELVHRPLEGVAGVQSRALEDSLSAVFEPLLNLRAFPRSLCQIVVQGLAPAPAAYPSSSPFGAPSQRNGWPRDSNADADEDEDMDGETKEEEGASPLAGYSFSARAAALNAASLATLHAGSVGLRAFPIAVSLALNTDGDLLVDPTLDEETGAQARFGFGWAFGAGISSKKDDADEEAELVWAEAEGDFSKQEFDAARDLSRRKAEEVLDFVKEKVGEYFEQ